MSETARRLSQYVRNGVLSTLAVRKDNYHLYKLWTSNRTVLTRFFESVGTEILDGTVSTDDDMRKLLTYRFGRDVVVRAKDDSTLYQKVYYMARKNKMGVTDYLEKLGFEKNEGPDYVRLHDTQNLSFREISILLDIPRSTVHRKYTEQKNTAKGDAKR